ncbi:MAG: hypothetical protein ABR521_07895 [Gaiellaceae bacterium]
MRSSLGPAGRALRRNWWLVALALVVPAGAGGIALWERFDGLYGQDSFAYLSYATGPLRHSLAGLDLPPPFYWPPGYPLLVALASYGVGRGPLAGQLVSMAAAASVPVSTALLARELWPAPPRAWLRPPIVPLVAGLVVAFNGQLWQSSVVVMSDTLGVALATAGVAALARYGRRGGLRWLLLAAGLLAAATGTRWVYGIVALPCAVYALSVIVRRPARVALAHAGAALGLALAFLSPVLARPLLHGGGYRSFAGSFETHTWNPLWIFQREFVAADGMLSYSLPTGLYFAVAPAHWRFLTPVLAPLLLPGIWAVARRRAAAPVLLLVGWAAVVYLFHAGAGYQTFRFTLAYLPPLAILAGIGAEWVWGRLAGRRFAAVAATAALGVGLALMALGGTHTTRSLIALKNDGLELVRWAEASVPPDGAVITFNLTSTFRHYSRLRTIELYEQTPARLRLLLASRRPLVVLVDVPSLRGQWRRRAPGRNFRWLEDEAGLTRIGTRRGFTLFRVGR